MKYKYIGFPIKDGCHVDGADKGIDVLKEKIEFDKIIEIEKSNNDLQNVITSCLKLSSTVDNIISEGNIPVTIGGDHSLAIGSIAGSANNQEIGIIWFDTHPDSNTFETTTTFNIHGYPLGASMGFGLKELTNLYSDKTKVKTENVVMIGIDDIDKPEKELIEKYNIKNFTLNDIKNKGIEYCVKETINYLKDKVSKIHLSFDIDAINTLDSPGVNVPNRWDRGLKKEEALYTFETLIKELNIISIDIVEYNPITDKDNKSLNIVLDVIKILEKTKEL